MICPEGELLSAYLDGEATPLERRRVDRHLAGCAGCRGSLASTRRLKAVVGHLTPPAMPASLREDLERLIPAAAVSAADRAIPRGRVPGPEGAGISSPDGSVRSAASNIRLGAAEPAQPGAPWSRWFQALRIRLVGSELNPGRVLSTEKPGTNVAARMPQASLGRPRRGPVLALGACAGLCALGALSLWIKSRGSEIPLEALLEAHGRFSLPRASAIGAAAWLEPGDYFSAEDVRDDR